MAIETHVHQLPIYLKAPDASGNHTAIRLNALDYVGACSCPRSHMFVLGDFIGSNSSSTTV